MKQKKSKEKKRPYLEDASWTHFQFNSWNSIFCLNDSQN